MVAGADVSVVTQSLGGSSYPYEVVRRPSKARLLALGNRADIILQSNISLGTLLPLLSLRKPIVITHHTWLTRSDGSWGWQGKLKRLVLPLCQNLAVSEAVARSLPVPARVVVNPFEYSAFYQHSESIRDRDIVFMGRLVSDKGCDLLLHALALLKQRGIVALASIIGDGAERQNLENLSRQLGVAGQVRFLGALTQGRAREVARHRIMVVPSRWVEPFGIVALEGIAAGCAVVASSQGGLREAVGECGVFFTNGDIKEFANAIENLYVDESQRQALVAKGPRHLSNFDPRSVADCYMSIFDALLCKTRT